MNSSQMELKRPWKLASLVLMAAGSFATSAAFADENLPSNETWLRGATIADLSPLTTEQRYQAFVNAPQDTEAQFETSPPAAKDNASDEVGDESVHPRMAKVSDGRFELPVIAAASIETASIGNGRTPDGFRKGVSPPAQPLRESGAQRGDWNWTAAEWAAANTFSNPRYFEDRMLERHGHERFPKLQPMVSGVRFFATIPALPYLMTLSNPCKKESTLGYYRPGSAAPGFKQCPPWNRKAAMVQAGAVAGFVLALP